MRSIRSKKSRLLAMLNGNYPISLGSAASTLYGGNTELNRLRVVRLLATYRHNSSDFTYRVRDGEVVNTPA